jgi:outer membrane biosynthesis protein TonB
VRAEPISLLAHPETNEPMNHRFFEPGSRQDVVVIPIIWVMIALSILVHVAALVLLLMHLLRDKDQEQTEASERLQVRIAAQATPAPPVARLQEPEPPRAIIQPPKPTVRQRPPPLVAPSKREAPAIPLPPPPPPVPTPPVAAAPPSADFGSIVQAKRRARGEQDAPEADDEKALFDSKIAANLPTSARGVAAQTRNGGGIFQIKRMAYDDAAFEFYGWNKEMGRRTPQLIEVRKGDNADMRIAVVRRMIAIIREHEKADFVWENPQKERKYTLSARVSDNAALEAFLMNEFFGDSSSVH